RPTWRTRMTHSALTGAGATVLALALAACTSTPQQAERGSPGANAPLATTSSVERAHANLAPASGSLVSGRLMLSPMAGGLHLKGEIGGLKPGGTHAIHIHEKGDCSAADASSAGGHFNPG